MKTLLATGALALAVAAFVAPAQAYTVTAAGSGSVALPPSADAASLDPNSTTTNAGSFTLQTVTFTVGNSGSLIALIPVTLTELVTIDGIAQLISVYGTLDVESPATTNVDTLTLNSSGPFMFGGVQLTIDGTTTNSGGVGSVFTVDLPATLTAVPEPAGVALFGLGVAALAGIRRRRV